MSLQALSLTADQATLATLAAPTAAPTAYGSAGTETLWVYLKKGYDCKVCNVLGSAIFVTGGSIFSLPVTTASSGTSTTVTMTNTSGIIAGQFVYGFGIAMGTYVVSVSANTSIVLSITAVTTLNQILTFASGAIYDGSTFRNDIPASFAGSPDKALGQTGQYVQTAVVMASYVGQSDRLNGKPPQSTPKLRTRRMYLRYDLTGLPIGSRSFWDDEVLGDGDAPRVYAK